MHVNACILLGWLQRWNEGLQLSYEWDVDKLRELSGNFAQVEEQCGKLRDTVREQLKGVWSAHVPVQGRALAAYNNRRMHALCVGYLLHTRPPRSQPCLREASPPAAPASSPRVQQLVIDLARPVLASRRARMHARSRTQVMSMWKGGL